jgi:hypothetical protein
MPEWMAAPPSTTANASTIPAALDMEAPAPRKITLGRVVPAPVPEPISRPASAGPSRGPASPVQVTSGAEEEEEDVVDLDEREDTPPRRNGDARREERSRHGLIDTQPDAVSYSGSAPGTPPRMTIPPRLSIHRTNSYVPPVVTPNPDQSMENEDIVELDTREETPRRRVQTHQRPIVQRELDAVVSRHATDQEMSNPDESEDDDVLPIEREPVPMPASPPPQAIPIPGIDRTYSMAQPMAVPEPPTKNYKGTTSIVAKARAIVRATKGTDAPAGKKGKGRERERDQGPDLKKELSKLDAEVSRGCSLLDFHAEDDASTDHLDR